MSRFAIALPFRPDSRLYRLLAGLGLASRPGGSARAAKLDLDRLSNHHLRDLGFQPRLYGEGWLAAPWLPLNHDRPRPDHLPPI